MVWQVAKDGEEPFWGMLPDEIDDLKHSDKDLSHLLTDLPEDTPEPFRRVIIEMTRYLPDERGNLSTVRETILGCEGDNSG